MAEEILVSKCWHVSNICIYHCGPVDCRRSLNILYRKYWGLSILCWLWGITSYHTTGLLCAVLICLITISTDGPDGDVNGNQFSLNTDLSVQLGQISLMLFVVVSQSVSQSVRLEDCHEDLRHCLAGSHQASPQFPAWSHRPRLSLWRSPDWTCPPLHQPPLHQVHTSNLQHSITSTTSINNVQISVVYPALHCQ